MPIESHWNVWSSTAAKKKKRIFISQKILTWENINSNFVKYCKYVNKQSTGFYGCVTIQHMHLQIRHAFRTTTEFQLYAVSSFPEGEGQ